MTAVAVALQDLTEAFASRVRARGAHSQSPLHRDDFAVSAGLMDDFSAGSANQRAPVKGAGDVDVEDVALVRRGSERAIAKFNVAIDRVRSSLDAG